MNRYALAAVLIFAAGPSLAGARRLLASHRDGRAA